MKTFLEEFKKFAVQGNMVDLAIGIIIGTAFNKVLQTIVEDIVMPPLSWMTLGVHISKLSFVLREGSLDVEEIAIGYGELIEVSIDFLIIALTVFLVVRVMNNLRKQAADPQDPEVETPKNIELLSRIEKLLQEQNELLESKKNTST